MRDPAAPRVHRQSFNHRHHKGAPVSQPYPEEGIGKFSAGGAPTPSLRAALEALLLVVDEPVAEVTLAQVLERPRTEVAAALAALATEYAESDRGFELRAVAGGWRLYTRPDLAPYVERCVLDGQQARLSQPALEALAVIADRQRLQRGLAQPGLLTVEDEALHVRREIGPGVEPPAAGHCAQLEAAVGLGVLGRQGGQRRGHFGAGALQHLRQRHLGDRLVNDQQQGLQRGPQRGGGRTACAELPDPFFGVRLAHWCTLVVSVVEGLPMHPRCRRVSHNSSWTSKRQASRAMTRRLPRTRRPSTGLSATERRTVSEPAAASWHPKSGASPLGLAARTLR